MDKTKCNNDKCELKETCLRWTAEPNERQSYATFYPQNGKCPFYIKNRRGD
jgi:hypothetical protein